MKGPYMYSVIIVDDEKHCIIDLQKTVTWEIYGYRVVETFSVPEEAEAAILGFQPDIVFVDIRMPRIDGLTLIQNLRKMKYEGEFVIVSGYDDFKYTKEAIQAGVFDYCLKPIDEEEVIEILRRISKKLKMKKDDTEDESVEALEATASSKLFTKIVEYLYMNIHKKISVQDICSEFSISKTYCNKLFRKYKDISFNTFMNEMRIEIACKLLKETDFSVQKVAEKVGIMDYYYFSKKFKSVMGLTPTQYRKQEV